MRKYNLSNQIELDNNNQELNDKVYSLLIDWKNDRFLSNAKKIAQESRTSRSIEEIERNYISDLAEEISSSQNCTEYKADDKKSIPNELLSILECTIDNPVKKEDVPSFLKFLLAKEGSVEKERKIFYDYLFAKFQEREIEKTKK